jgi:hypothetical protein
LQCWRPHKLLQLHIDVLPSVLQVLDFLHQQAFLDQAALLLC